MYDFNLLKPISNIFHVLGAFIGGLGVIAGIYLFTEGGYGILLGIGFILGGGLLALLFILFSQLINLFLQIEQNTHK